MRITDIRVASVPISSPIANAYIDFSKMDAAVVAVITDVVRDGSPVVGYGFNSNGRYAPIGLLRERFVPRLLEADPVSLLDSSGDNLDPHKIWATLMTAEKPGGHGERSVAVGTLDMAIWDAVAKIEEVPLYRLLADRYNDGMVHDPVWVYAAGGYYAPGKGLRELQEEMRDYLDLGYEVVKMKIGGTTLADDLARIEAVLRRGNLRAETPAGERVVHGPVVIDVSRHEVLVDDQSIDLTATEMRLLHFLASHPGRVFSRSQLLSRVIGENAIVIERNIDVHVRSIRKKLGEHRDLIQTVRGVGYRFRAGE